MFRFRVTPPYGTRITDPDELGTGAVVLSTG
jgi:hypothetical protein